MKKTNFSIKQADGVWYFRDELWEANHGPYDSEEECIAELNDFIDWLNSFNEDYGLGVG